MLTNDEQTVRKANDSLQKNETVFTILSKIKNETKRDSNSSSIAKKHPSNETQSDQSNNITEVHTPAKNKSEIHKKNSVEVNEVSTNKNDNRKMQIKEDIDFSNNKKHLKEKQKLTGTKSVTLNVDENNTNKNSTRNNSTAIDNTLTVIAQANTKKKDGNSVKVDSVSTHKILSQTKKDKADHSNNISVKKNGKNSNTHTQKEESESVSVPEKGRQWSPTLERIKHFLGIKM